MDHSKSVSIQNTDIHDSRCSPVAEARGETRRGGGNPHIFLKNAILYGMLPLPSSQICATCLGYHHNLQP